MESRPESFCEKNKNFYWKKIPNIFKVINLTKNEYT